MVFAGKLIRLAWFKEYKNAPWLENAVEKVAVAKSVKSKSIVADQPRKPLALVKQLWELDMPQHVTVD